MNRSVFERYYDKDMWYESQVLNKMKLPPVMAKYEAQRLSEACSAESEASLNFTINSFTLITH